MYLACSTRTMANAKRLVSDPQETRRPLPRLVEARSAVVAPRSPMTRPVLTPADGLRRIIELVARMHGATYAEVIGKSRKVRIVHARVAAIGAIKNIRPCMSLPAMGKLFGGRDHTTVLWALVKWEGRK